MLINAPTTPHLSPNGPKCPQTSTNVPKLPISQMSQNVPKRPKTSQNVPKRPKTSQNVPFYTSDLGNLQKRQTFWDVLGRDTPPYNIIFTWLEIFLNFERQNNK